MVFVSGGAEHRVSAQTSDENAALRTAANHFGTKKARAEAARAFICAM